ncbi:hypothetical protein [Testudinibacter sp. TR-2022]|nr:hypothetical protein [Testudinibacter sp. TR-2022]
MKPNGKFRYSGDIHSGNKESNMKAMIIGASGATSKALLQQLLNDSAFG